MLTSVTGCAYRSSEEEGNVTSSHRLSNVAYLSLYVIGSPMLLTGKLSRVVG